MRPAPLSEFIHTCGLLGEQALINLVGAGGAAGTGGGGRKAPRFGSSAASSAATAGSGQQHQQQHGKVSLRVLAQDVKAALRTNPIFRKLIGAE